MSNQSAAIGTGYVFLPKKADWLDDFKMKELSLPNGKFDNQVDSVSQFLEWVQRQEKAAIKFGLAVGHVQAPIEGITILIFVAVICLRIIFVLI